MLRFIHSQVVGLFHSGQNWQDAESDGDRKSSKLIALVLGLMAVSFVVLPFLLDFLSERSAMRSIFLSVPLLVAAKHFWHGASMRWILMGLIKNWLSIGLLVYIYLVLGAIAVQAFKGGEFINIGKQCGILMMALGFVGGVTSWIQAGILRDASQPDKAKVVALRFYALIWLGFFLGGTLALANATGWADWFFVEVLGW